jgi:holin-like protein
MIEALAVLLLAQLAGEALARGLALPVPGPVIGLILLAGVLTWRGVGSALHDAAHGLLRNLALLFVPAGVGIVQHAPLMAREGPAIAVALVVSTVLTLIVTVGVYLVVARLARRPDAAPPVEGDAP